MIKCDGKIGCLKNELLGILEPSRPLRSTSSNNMRANMEEGLIVACSASSTAAPLLIIAEGSKFCLAAESV